MRALLPVLRRLGRIDLGVATPAAILVAAGILLIRSADQGGGHLHLAQIRWLGVSTLAILPLLLIPYPRILRWAPFFYLAGLVLLVLVLTVGPVINGSRRWLPLGTTGFQPSELMKVATVLMMARLLRLGQVLHRPLHEFRPLLVAAVPAALVVVQPDLGTGLLFLPVGLAVAVVAGASLRGLAAGALLVVLAGFLGHQVLLEDYQRERIWSTYNLDRMTPAQRAGPGYQLQQSLLAVGNGGLLGHGYREGPTIQSGRLPYQHNDFIFAVVAEEEGLLGTAGLLLLYSVLVVAVFRVAHQGRDPAGRIICVGVGTLIGCQVLVNMGVVLGLLPTKGLPLPLVSAGGSSLLATLCGLALVQNVAMHRPRFPITGLAPREEGTWSASLLEAGGLHRRSSGG